MVEFAHISDLHFGRADIGIANSLGEKLQQLQPDCVIISGDLTQRAKRKEYVEAAAFLKRLSVPCLVVPGNHDLSATSLLERFFFPWQKWNRILPVGLESTLSIKRTVMVGINTVRLSDFSLDWSRGSISQSQLQFITSGFNKASSTHLRVLVAHHPFWLPKRFAKRNLIYGRDTALRQFAECGPDLILSGHIHVPFVHVLRGIIISHAGTACSTRYVEEKSNSFNMIRGDSTQVKIQRYSWIKNDFIPDKQFVFTSPNENRGICSIRKWAYA